MEKAMSENDDGPKIIIDSEWKEDAAKEKARISEEVDKTVRQEPLPEPSLVELVNMIVMQASVGLSGYKGPDGKTLPADPGVAKHYIDLLELLRDKTAGNVTDDEKNLLDGILHEMRMTYVQVVSGNAAPPPSPSPSA